MFLTQEETQRVKDVCIRIWTASFWPLVALAFGALIGAVIATTRVINDCKYTNTFRVDSQAFTCQRKL